MMEELLEYRQRMINRFAEAPALIDSAMAKIPAHNQSLEEGDWNAHQVITHMRDVNSQVYLPRLQRIMTESDPIFKNFDGDAWMVDHYDPHEPLGAILNELKEQCLSTAEWLHQLAPPSWNRNGIHPTIGTHTLQWWVERTLAHINEHVAQLEGSVLDKE
ncbi:MAG TPA: DinB family protein [Anaerolineales bacterium]|nr:DinB family protein [Anaerolineales bacterium]